MKKGLRKIRFTEQIQTLCYEIMAKTLQIESDILDITDTLESRFCNDDPELFPQNIGTLF